ncbi:MAG TPA: DUF2207 domain-containing protein [Longimicrobiales bacterium]|nr:DUF2207 domain-containing protein [Longimicrobiales bacterium]
MRRSLLLLLLVLLGLSALPARALARSLEIRDFHSSIVVRRDGSIRVTERITVHFEGTWNGIYRVIPVAYRTDRGLNYSLRLRVTSVTDDAGHTLYTEQERDGGSLRIRMHVPGATDVTRTLVLTYEVANGLRFFEEHDELYWNVTGDNWDFPIQRVTAEVILPPAAAGVRATSFAGARGSIESGGAGEQVGNGVYFRSARPLGFHEGMTVVVGWNPGVVHRPTAVEQARMLFASNALMLVPLLALIAMWLLWRRWGRDPDPGSIYVRYEPPPNLTPAEAGTLIDDSPDARDITATLVDLAVRGFVVIDEKKQDQLFGLVSTTDYELSLLRPEAWPELKPHERALLQALSVHADDDRVLLSELQNQFYKHMPQITRHLSKSLTAGGYYRTHPKLVRGAWLVGAVAAAGGVAAIGTALSVRYGIAELTTILAAAGTFLVMAAFAWFMPARTMEGARMHAWLRGFEEFLSRVEKDRLERMIDSPQTFEKFLPYAMAFGVEKNWARAFEGLASTPPDWYHSSHGGPFRPNVFVTDLGRMTRTASSAMTSSPRSSGGGSSGSSGFSGGSSGGGFGGGGGGGF